MSYAQEEGSRTIVVMDVLLWNSNLEMVREYVQGASAGTEGGSLDTDRRDVGTGVGKSMSRVAGRKVCG